MQQKQLHLPSLPKSYYTYGIKIAKSIVIIIHSFWRYIGISLLTDENIHLINYASMKVGVGAFSGCVLVLG